MGEPVSIPEKIFVRWCEKMSGEESIPESVVETIRRLKRQGKLGEEDALNEVLRQQGERR